MACIFVQIILTIPSNIHFRLSVREHFSSPLLQFAEKDEGSTFTLVECPSLVSSMTLYRISSN